MKVIIAPDSYKGSLTAVEVSQIMKEAISQEIPSVEIVLNPMADGGEGTLDALVTATAGEYQTVTVQGPLGEKIESRYGILGNGETAVIEAASICGLPMVPKTKRNPMNTTTFGIGEAIRSALDSGFKNIILGIGGSATNDGGMGMLQALGAEFRNQSGNLVDSRGSSLQMVATANFDSLDRRLKACNLLVASDVNNPLCGPDGASYVFGPQKGATPQQIENFDAWLDHYANVIEDSLTIDCRNIPGSGAAGGLGFALLILGAQLESGAAIVSSATGLHQNFSGARWAFTGEGQSDSQTLLGKVPAYIAKEAARHGCRTILISGSLGDGANKLDGLFASCHATLLSPMTLDEAMKQARKNLFETTRNVAKLLKLFA